MKKKILAAVIAAVTLFSSVPVFGADEELLEFSVTPVEESVLELASEEAEISEEIEAEEIEISEDAQADGSVFEEVQADGFVSTERYTSEEADTSLVEVRDDEFPGLASADEITADKAASFVYYAQYAYQVKSDYDIIAAYIKGEDGKYASRLFFIYDREYEEWLRYDYSKMAAETFLSKWEEKDSNGTTLYVPVEKMSGEKKVWHTDNSKTAIDESKIPVIAAADVAGINFAWKALSSIPFAKNGNTYEYAGEGKEPEPEPQPVPVPVPGEDKTAETDINGHHYTVIWTSSVSYNGLAHLWDQTKISAKNASKQVADIKVEIIRDGALVDTSNYTVTCKNNVNVTGYDGKKYQPYFSITLKGNYKKDNAKMSKEKLAFDITPCPVTSGKFQAKKVVVQGSKTTFTDLYFVFSDGRKVKLSAYNAKKKTGSFSAAGTESGVLIKGYNNLSGEGLLSMESPKKVTYEW